MAFRTYATLGRCLAIVPEPVALGAAALVGDALFELRRQQRQMVRSNLRRVLGAGHDDDMLVDRWARRSFRAYARYWVEGARLGRTSSVDVERRMLVEGLEHLTEGMQSGEGVVMALPHVGSWEYGGAFLAARDMPMTAVAERLDPPELFDYFVEQRAAMGLRIVPLDPYLTGTLMHTLRSGGLVGLLCDRDLVGNGVDVEFFGERTTMPAGPAMLALRTGARLVTAAVYSGPGPEHLGLIQAPLDTARRGPLRQEITRITQEIATRLEGLIRRAPEQWHVFQPLWNADRLRTGS
ncbi:MAG: phosphatidylinositol mannoside acyltransferase [Acidimicrobiales bacterium]